MLDSADGDGAAASRLKLKLVEDALELADVRADVVGDLFDDGGVELEAHGGGFSLDDGAAGFEVGGLNVDNEALGEAREKAVGEAGDGVGVAVGADDDLFAFLLEVVEGVEELFLGFFFAFDELDVVNDKDIDVAVLLGEVGDFLADGVDVVAVESLDGDVFDAGFGVFAGDFVADGLNEVSFADADATV